MNSKLKYMPIFRSRLQELLVLNSFDFEEQIYPCIEIIKELDRKPSNRIKRKPGFFDLSKEKTFEKVYLPLIEKIKASKVFIDLPLHLKPQKGMKPETIVFLRQIVGNRLMRTQYLKKLIPLASKIIPVISSFSNITGEQGSIQLQEFDLRPFFKNLAFRTYFTSFHRDIAQIRSVLKPEDYIIMDWGDLELDLKDGDQLDIIDELKKLNCAIIMHRNPFPKGLKMSDLPQGEIITTINNNHLEIYKDFGGHSFSDYAGIKKDNIDDGGVVSPGFIFYDAVINKFFGFRYKYGSHKKGETKPVLEEFETTIIPAVLKSEATKRMLNHPFKFLENNNGWKTINNINQGESGKSAAKFKKISMDHYLHCIKLKIINGELN